MSASTVAFVIPAFNEAESIEATLQSICNSPSRFEPTAVTVVDNGSTDGTAEIVRSFGAKLVERDGGTIASVRNAGVSQTSADVIVFIDADVTLTPQWHERIDASLDTLAADPMIVTGSHCRVPPSDRWLLKHWFASLEQARGAYLGTGHLIMTRELFDAIGGFDERLETGEDYDLCQRALATGATIAKDPLLAVYHHGFPQTLGRFFAREAWHGLGDVQSAATAFGSKVFVAALVLFVLLVAAAWAAIAGRWDLAGIGLVAAAVYLLLLSAIKFRGRPVKSILVNSVFLAPYLLGRLWSVVRRMRGKP